MIEYKKIMHSCYKGLWYAYEPNDNMWIISDRQDGMGNVVFCNADYYRIDQCFEFFKNNLLCETI